MSTNPVNAWDAKLLTVSETTFGVTPAPANVAAYAAQAIEFINASLGPASDNGVVRPKKDRSAGRGMQSGYVEGRVAPFPWEVSASVKTRSAIDADPRELALYKAAGLKKTTNAGVSCVLSPSQTPIESLDYTPTSLTRLFGTSPATYEAEILRGCTATKLKFEGGDKELLVTASGNGISKVTQGSLDSITVLIGATSLTITAEESYRLGLGYYFCEAECIQVTACTPGGTTATIARGALGTTAAAHTAKPLQPFVPTGIVYAGTPIGEVIGSTSIGGVNLRSLGWSFEFTTGLDLLPGESGSRYVQGAKYGRYDAKLMVKAVLSGDQVSLLGKATNRLNVSTVLSQGTGTGGTWTLTAPYGEVVGFAPPDTIADIAIVDIEVRLRDNSASDMFSITLT